MAISFATASKAQLAAFGETVTYLGSGSYSRVLTHNPSAGTYGAIVERDQIEDLPEAVGVKRPFFRIHLLQSSTLGVLPTEIDTQYSRFTMAARVGDSATVTLRVHRIVSQDGGMISLELR